MAKPLGAERRWRWSCIELAFPSGATLGHNGARHGFFHLTGFVLGASNLRRKQQAFNFAEIQTALVVATIKGHQQPDIRFVSILSHTATIFERFAVVVLSLWKPLLGG